MERLCGVIDLMYRLLHRRDSGLSGVEASQPVAAMSNKIDLSSSSVSLARRISCFLVLMSVQLCCLGLFTLKGKEDIQGYVIYTWWLCSAVPLERCITASHYVLLTDHFDAMMKHFTSGMLSAPS